MKYFAKYLPVEGEIKRGDKAFDEHGVLQHLSKDVQLSLLKGINETYKLARLFLCSRDIQVGDKLTSSETGKFMSEEELFGGLDKPIKVIGLISPEATWVKEGNEFEENEIKIIDHNVKGAYIPISVEEKRYMGSYAKLVRIKGPCNHYH